MIPLKHSKLPSHSFVYNKNKTSTDQNGDKELILKAKEESKERKSIWSIKAKYPKS